MSIQKGRPWEIKTSKHDVIVNCESDEELHAFVLANVGAHNAQALESTLCVSVGEHTALGRTLGIVGGDRTRDLDDSYALAVDLTLVEIDSAQTYMTSYTRCFSRFESDATFLMNAQWIGELNIGHRAHPNDGKIDIVSWNGLSYWERRSVFSRMKTGAFTPHPKIVESRRSSGSLSFDKPRRLVIDGVDYGRTRSLNYTVVPTALTVIL